MSATIYRRSWPIDPVLACYELQEALPGWLVTWKLGIQVIFRAEKIRLDGGVSAVEATLPGAVYTAIEQLFDEG